MSAHGLMHMVISNAHAGDPYKIDTHVYVYGQYVVELSMNSGGVMNMLTDTDENGDYVIPKSSIRMPIRRKWWPMPI